jgi:hypothetical protein
MGRDGYITTTQLADRTSVAASTWTKRRLTGDGPPFVRVGSRVIYRVEDVEVWLAARSRTSTSDES